MIDLVETFETALETAVLSIAELALGEAQMMAPKESGAFAKGLHLAIARGVPITVISILSSVPKPKAAWITEGTKAHEIGGDGQLLSNANNKFAIEDFGPVHGPVEHPGTKPDPWVARILAVMEIKAQVTVMDALERAFL